MRKLARWSCITFVASIAPAAAAVECNPNPVADVPEFSPIAVRLEPDILDRIVAACDPVSKAADSVVNLLAGAEAAVETPSVFDAAAGVQNVVAFARDTVVVAGGLEGHVLSCTGGALRDGLIEKLPSTLTASPQAYAELEESREKLAKALTAVQAKQQRGEAISRLEQAKLAGAARTVLKNAQATVGAVQGLLAAVSNVANDPASLIRDDEMQLEVAASLARENIANLERSCAISRAEADLRAFVMLGQQSLTAARLAEARAAKLASRDAALIDARLATGIDWQRDPEAARLAIETNRISADTYRSWVAHTSDRQQAAEKRAALERGLGEGLALCSALRQRAATVEARRAPFEKLVADGRAAIAACRLDDAEVILRQLQNLEGTACGAYLTENLLAEPPADRSGLLGPTDSGNATATAPRNPIPPSAQLRYARDEARAGCEAGTLRTPPPPPPPTTGVTVPPGAANVELVRIDPPEVPPTDVNWNTVTDGAIKYEAYAGTPAGVSGQYSWASPAATIGARGISITLEVQCATVRDNRFATGIGLFVHNFDLYVDGRKVDRAEAPANCGTGESVSASVTAQVVPRASYSDGEVAKIHIGPFWAGSVVYTYKARRTGP